MAKKMRKTGVIDHGSLVDTAMAAASQTLAQ